MNNHSNNNRPPSLLLPPDTMIHCNTNTDQMSVFERQRAQFQFQYQSGGGLSEVVARSLKPDPDFVDNGWPDFVGFDMNYAFSRTSSCSPPVAAATAGEKMSSSGVAGKRKAIAEDGAKDGKLKASVEESDSYFKNKTKKSRTCNKENSGENSKVTEVQKPDYIHVRARRGQATDSHSLAERARREKISERLKCLQDLVPGCNKITGKAGMLDEIINYVQSLQRQVEFLSMKLAALTQPLDINVDNLLTKEAFPASAASFEPNGMPSDTASFSFLQHNPIQQQISACVELDMGINSLDMAPDSIREPFLDSSCFTQIDPPTTWDIDLTNLYNSAFDQGRSTSFPSQHYTSSMEANNLKMEI